MAVCVATHQRPDGLERLLRSIEAVDVPADVRLRVEIADNDPNAGAVRSAERLRCATRWPVSVTHEPTPGVSAPRNATVLAALNAGADLLAFVDDDETVEPLWLVTHLDGRARFKAAVTTGPVHPDYPSNLAPWWSDTRLHGPEVKPTGTALPVCWTNNTVVARRVFDDLTAWFDEEFRWGGEDSEFFQRVAHAGHDIVWIAEAMVRETVPAARATLRWVGRRYLWAGRVKGVLERREHGRLSRCNLRRVAVGLFHVLRGITRLPRLALAPGPTLAMATRDVAFGLGQMSGAIAGGPRGGLQHG